MVICCCNPISGALWTTVLRVAARSRQLLQTDDRKGSGMQWKLRRLEKMRAVEIRWKLRNLESMRVTETTKVGWYGDLLCCYYEQLLQTCNDTDFRLLLDV